MEAKLNLFERPGGLSTSNTNTGLQWDEPYGWAPTNWIAVAGLDAMGFHADAARIAQHFDATVDAGFAADGTIREKYNVVAGNAQVQVSTGYKTERDRLRLDQRRVSEDEGNWPIKSGKPPISAAKNNGGASGVEAPLLFCVLPVLFGQAFSPINVECFAQCLRRSPRLAAADRDGIIAFSDDRLAGFGDHAQVARLQIELHLLRRARFEMNALESAQRRCGAPGTLGN